MTWYAECQRRKWYCINGWDAISWYSKYLYDEWYNSLTEEQKEKLEEVRRRREEKRKAELKSDILRLGTMIGTIFGGAHSPTNRDKYHGLYNENGNINLH